MSIDPSPPTLSPISAVQPYPNKHLSENTPPPTLTPIIPVPSPNKVTLNNTVSMKVTPVMIVSDKAGSADSEQSPSQLVVRKLGSEMSGASTFSPRKFIIARIQQDPVANANPIVLSNSRGNTQVATFAKMIHLKNDKVIKRLLQDKDSLAKLREVSRK